MKDRFCTVCDTAIKLTKIADMTFPQSVCMKCSKINQGYTLSQKALVDDLRMSVEPYRIHGFLCLFEKHAGQPEKYKDLRGQVIWAVTHYGLVKTDGIIKQLKYTVERLDGNNPDLP